MFLRLLEPIIAVLLFVLWVTEIVIPTIRGTKWFPLLRRRRDRRLELTRQMKAEREKAEALEIEQELKTLHDVNERKSSALRKENERGDIPSV